MVRETPAQDPACRPTYCGRVMNVLPISCCHSVSLRGGEPVGQSTVLLINHDLSPRQAEGMINRRIYLSAMSPLGHRGYVA